MALWAMHRRLNKPPQIQQSERRLKPAPRVTATPTAPALPLATPQTATPTNPKPGSAAPTKASPGPELSTFTPRAIVPNVPADVAVPELPADRIIEAQFAHLQGLVKQMAAEVAGPKATTPDPDRATPQPQRSAPYVPFPSTTTRAAAAQLPSTAGLAAAPSQAASPLGLSFAEAVAAERFDVMLEPIQSLSEHTARHFEVTVRFRDANNVILPATEVAQIARATGLSASVDSLKLPRVAKVAQRVQSRSGTPADVLATVTGASLADHDFIDAFANAFTKGATGAVVLSFAQADVRAFARIHWSTLATMADMGLRFALSDVTDLDMDFDLLRARSFVFAKLDAGVFLDGLPFGAGIIPANDICRHIADAGLDLIVDRIDDATQLGRVLEHGVVFGQGILFGGARPVRQDILN
jgi:cyclic-di-GMP phosphodiesterase, flagellum assembly factor TipF